MGKIIIHVNQHVIRRNHKTGERKPVLTVKRGRTNTYATSVEVLGPCRVVYSPDAPLSCGARVWIETTGPVRLEGEAFPPPQPSGD
jgi:hypothetical protein